MPGPGLARAIDGPASIIQIEWLLETIEAQDKRIAELEKKVAGG